MMSNIASCCPLICKLSLHNAIPFKDDGHVYYSFSRFRSLKDLTLEECKTQEVSSRSLERLHLFTEYHKLSIKLDVPSICKVRFDIVGKNIPSLSFVEQTLNRVEPIENLSLSLDMGLPDLYKGCRYKMGDIRGLPVPKVESLTLDMFRLRALDYFSFFRGLFQICRLKFIIVNYRMGGIGTIANNNTLCKTLARGLDDKCMYDLHDLGEVNVHLFDEDVDAWRPLPLESLLDPSISPSGDIIWNGLLCKTLARGLDDKSMYDLHDLEEVNLQFFDEDVDEWQSKALESLLDPSISPSGRQTIRFQLKWKMWPSGAFRLYIWVAECRKLSLMP
ncbi:hypothetical protein CASFOL_006703 [Castilleja foliolosa]|uniref:Uncharacterized protein n=1 Tax=Castilleja foliolosa TaxID=1961234 RepID=A0ABD3E753_9LAMI